MKRRTAAALLIVALQPLLGTGCSGEEHGTVMPDQPSASSSALRSVATRWVAQGVVSTPEILTVLPDGNVKVDGCPSPIARLTPTRSAFEWNPVRSACENPKLASLTNVALAEVANGELTLFDSDNAEIARYAESGFD